MKDIPQPSSVYMPPHHRLRSVISSPAAIVPNNNHNSFVNGVSAEVSELSFHPGAFTSDIDSWKWKLTRLLHCNDKQELVSRGKKDRRDYEQIAALANRMGLHSHLYAKVLVVSKVPLPNYRFDLDDKLPQREVSLSNELQKRVDTHLTDYLSYKAKTMNGSRNNLFSRTSSNINDELLFDQPEPLSQCQVAKESFGEEVCNSTLNNEHGRWLEDATVS